jgi:hypothetical protein
MLSGYTTMVDTPPYGCFPGSDDDDDDDNDDKCGTSHCVPQVRLSLSEELNKCQHGRVM